MDQRSQLFFASTVLPFDQFSPFGSVSKLFLTEKEEEEEKKKQYATLEISNFSPGGHHQVRLSIRVESRTLEAPYYLCFSGHINFKKENFCMTLQ